MANEDKDTLLRPTPEVEHPAGGHSEVPLEEQIATLRKDLEAAQLEVRQNLDQAQRAQAELINYRKRADDERVSFQRYASSRLIAKLLPIVDELELAVTQAGEHTTNDSWLEGVRLIQRKLANLLSSEGVVRIDANGVIFNPLEHEAVDTEETTRHPPGYITKEMRPGYRLHDRIIQAAQVVVAKEPPKNTGPNNSPQVKESEYD
jgi:molecular chaperone GrpE